MTKYLDPETPEVSNLVVWFILGSERALIMYLWKQSLLPSGIIFQPKIVSLTTLFQGQPK